MFDGHHDQVQSLGDLFNAGETAELTFSNLPHRKKLTIASMLLPTNDEARVNIPGTVCGLQPFSPNDE